MNAIGVFANSLSCALEVISGLSTVLITDQWFVLKDQQALDDLAALKADIEKWGQDNLAKITTRRGR